MTNENYSDDGRQSAKDVIDDMVKRAENKAAGFRALRDEIKWDSLSAEAEESLWMTFISMRQRAGF